jgi:mandelate racemase
LLQVRAVDVPLTPPLRTAAGAIRSAPLVLLGLATEQGVVGHAYLFAYTPRPPSGRRRR